MRNQNLKLRSYVTIGMLSSIAFVLMLIKFPLPGFPVFLQIDFSDVPAINCSDYNGTYSWYFSRIL